MLDRTEARGFWSVGWPLLMLAVLAALAARACVPPPASSAPFDVAAASRAANEAALAQMEALVAAPADATPERVLAALNALSVNFASGSAQVPPEASAVLAAAAGVVALLPPTSVLVVTGHTDNSGTHTVNLALSQRRAESVLTELMARGLPRGRLRAVGVGDAQPVATNATDAGRYANRRIAFALAQP